MRESMTQESSKLSLLSRRAVRKKRFPRGTPAFVCIGRPVSRILDLRFGATARSRASTAAAGSFVSKIRPDLKGMSPQRISTERSIAQQTSLGGLYDLAMTMECLQPSACLIGGSASYVRDGTGQFGLSHGLRSNTPLSLRRTCPGTGRRPRSTALPFAIN